MGSIWVNFAPHLSAMRCTGVYSHFAAQSRSVRDFLQHSLVQLHPRHSPLKRSRQRSHIEFRRRRLVQRVFFVASA
jgi:hypothetical protein